MNPRLFALASVVMVAGLSGAAAQEPSPSADPGTNPRPSSPAAVNPDPTGANEAPTMVGSPMRQIKVDELEGMDVLGADGKKIAEIERVVERTADNKQFVVVERGGFLGHRRQGNADPARQHSGAGREGDAAQPGRGAA
jgi:hypothetical protein